MNELNAQFRAIAEAYTHALQETLGERLVSVAMFSSVARGKAGPHSDIDLFVVLEEAPRGMTRRVLLEPAREAVTPCWSRYGTAGYIPMWWKLSAPAKRPEAFTPFIWT